MVESVASKTFRCDTIQPLRFNPVATAENINVGLQIDNVDESRLSYLPVDAGGSVSAIEHAIILLDVLREEKRKNEVECDQFQELVRKLAKAEELIDQQKDRIEVLANAVAELEKSRGLVKPPITRDTELHELWYMNSLLVADSAMFLSTTAPQS